MGHRLSRAGLVLLAVSCLPPSGQAAEVEALAVGRQMPPLTGDLLSGDEATLPDAARGRVALLALGFSYGSRFAVEAWCSRFRDAFEGREEVTDYEVPMLGGAARMGRWFIDRGMRRNTPRELHDRVLTVYGDTGAWKRRLGVADDKAAYLILVDGTGRVAWLHSGAFDASRFDELREAVESLLRR
jgi:hypothetical protein